MIDFTREQPVTLSDVADRFQFSLQTVRRWIKRGENGVKLEHVKVGREYRTSMEATQRFLARLSKPSRQPQPAVTYDDPHGDRQRSHDSLVHALG